MNTPELPIVATIAGQVYSRADVLAWEDARIDAAARKVGLPVPEPGPVAQRREAWLQSKRGLGDAELRRRLARDIRVADAVAELSAAVSRRRRVSVTDLTVPGGSAAGFVDWFNEITSSSNRDEMERACPDHFILRMADGRQEVIETNGGAPLAALFTIDYDDVSTLVTPIDPAFDVRVDGVARSAKGKAIGGVRHQFRDTPDGVHARLLVEFPLPMLPSIVRGHHFHLACEFSNWFEAAIAADA
ncbi:hypothetical protein [Gordonia neofelifaecis]|uniref:Uncharacterized protein n=1 Tax=Gordonia neofelifaecis NRRL B-59395 TaxID=644548 RepID=F1YNI5_9ACTN|nr:hypothetical protein [Gordonia neofelifaecis]EGD53722.1 hypothetical protein SCNU_17335 [Gordonia neofelifaecis NRRL B-59395]